MAAKRVKAAKVAPTLGDLIDQLYTMGVERRAAQKAVDDMKAAEREIENKLINEYDRKSLSSAAGKLATVSVSNKVVPNVVDWDEVYKYITKHKAFELLQKRISVTAWNERREQGEEVKGTESFTVVSVSVHKRGSAA